MKFTNVELCENFGTDYSPSQVSLLAITHHLNKSNLRSGNQRRRRRDCRDCSGSSLNQKLLGHRKEKGQEKEKRGEEGKKNKEKNKNFHEMSVDEKSIVRD